VRLLTMAMAKAKARTWVRQMQQDSLPENKQITVKSHNAQMMDSGSMMCNAKGVWGKAEGSIGDLGEVGMDAER
jgi:hypothetical protein